jgi:hypothetical protein
MIGLGSRITNINIATTFYNTSDNANILHLDGAGDFVYVPDDDLLSFTGDNELDDIPFSIACWVKRDSASNDGLISKGYATNNTLEYRVFWIGGDIYVDISDGGNSTGDYIRATFHNPDTDWQHIIITYDPGDPSNGIKFYKNAISQPAVTVNSNETWIGMTNYSGILLIGAIEDTDYQLGGELCQFMMWRDHAISPHEAKYLYAEGLASRNPLLSSSDYSGDTKLVIWFPFRSDINDDSTKGFNATAVGNAEIATGRPY